MALPTTVAFPVIGKGMPEPTGTPQDFVNLVEQDPPHWIYHLEIRRARKPRNDFMAVSPGTVDRLAQKLGLTGGFRIRPLEFLHDELPAPEDCSPYAFGLDNYFPAESSLLGLAAGLVAAATERPLPPTVLFSGCLRKLSRPLRLGRTASIEQKVLLSFGQEPGYAIQRVVDLLYQHHDTWKHLGTPEQRVLPGKVKLFLIPTSGLGETLAFGPSLTAERLPRASLADFGQGQLADVLASVDGLADGGMLLVQVPTVWHALHLLGYHHTHAFPAKCAAAVTAEPIHVFRLRQRATTEADPTAQLPGPGLDVQQELAELEMRLARAGAKDIYTRLKTILAQACRRLRCKSGDLAIVSSEADWLRVFARHGPGAESLPHFVPRDTGITGRVLRTSARVVVENAAADPDLAAALASIDRLVSRYGAERAREFEAFLRQVRSCVKVPLREGENTLGILCLHRDYPGTFNTNLLGLVEALAQRATQEVAAFLREEQARQRRPAGEGLSSTEELARRHAHPSHATARRALCRELAQLAHERSGAYRVTVGLLNPGRTALVAVAGAADAENLLTEFWTRVFPLEDDSAARLALTSGQSYVIPDTTRKDIVFRPVAPAAVSHASILLRAGRHTLGVLGLDWNRPGGCDEGMLALLDEMAGRYALALAAHTPDDLLSAVDGCCGDLGQRDEDGAYWRFLRLVARAVGAVDADLFWLRQATSRYHLVASLLHPEGVKQDLSCAPGDGVTGWVARHNRPARVADLRSATELRALGDVPPMWEGKWYDGERDGANFTYLAVPVAVGDEVLGVVRFTAENAATAFGQYEQEIAADTAARLAWWLTQRAEAVARRGILDAASEHLRTFRDAEVAGSIALADEEAALLGRLARELARWLHAERIWAWPLTAANTFGPALVQGPSGTAAAEPLSPSALEEELGAEPYLHGPLPGQAVTSGPAGATAERPYVALRMQASGQTLALFLAAVRAGQAVPENSLEQAAALLEHVAEVVLTGRQVVRLGPGGA